MKKASLILSLLFVGQSLISQKGKYGNVSGPNTTFPLPVLVEEVKSTGNEVVIPYKKYKLTNGLTVLVHEDHSDPVVHVDVTYHIGSAREQQGRSGFAHFFEHMMFQGSKNVADEQHFKIITEAGGTLNGTTNTDRTNYFETVPSNQLEKMLWLESDRMGFLLDSVTQKKFEVQRATVKNERGQRYDNAPYGLVSEKIGEALYPQGHGYSWTTIGYIEDLNRVDVNDLKRFYMRWYGPNNAVLTIAGDVKTDSVMLMVQKYFGSIERGVVVKPQVLNPVKLTANRYLSYEDNVKFPMINIVFPTAKMHTKDNAALEVLGNILSGSQGSPFYKAFIETKKANSANSYQMGRELAGQFLIAIRANPETPLSEVEKTIKQVLADWEKKGVSDDDILKFKASYQSGLYNRLSTVSGKGATLAAYFTFTGDANYIKKDIATYLSITKADVMRVYNTYIKNKPSVILSCLPKGKGDLRAKADNWKMYERKVEKESKEYLNLKYVQPVDVFDRSVMPQQGPASPVPVPDFYTSKINSQIPLIGVEEKEIPKVTITLKFKAGHRYETKEKSGLAQLAAAMLEQSTLKTSAVELENKLERLGSNINFYSGIDELSVNVTSLKQNVSATLKILEEYLLEPKFDAAEFEVKKKRVLDRIIQGQSNAGRIADNTFNRLIYGNDHIMSYPSEGTMETIAAIKLEDVKNYYASLNTSMLTVAVSGDITKENIEKELNFLSKLKSGTPMSVTEINVPDVSKTKIYFVDKKNAAQSEIRIGYMALPYDFDGDYFKCQMMNYSFAGAFNSRINYYLREIKGWTYGCRGGFSGSKYPGTYLISGGFKANTTDSSLTEMFKIMKQYAENGVNDEELLFTKNAMAQNDALNYESPFQKLGFILNVMEYNLPKDYVARQTKVLKEINKEEINVLAKKYLPYNNMVVVVVGDKAENLEKVKKLGFEVIELDVNGKVLN